MLNTPSCGALQAYIASSPRIPHPPPSRVLCRSKNVPVKIDEPSASLGVRFRGQSTQRSSRYVTHCASHVDVDPTSSARSQGSAEGAHEVGQSPSHISVGPCAPSPQTSLEESKHVRD